MKKVQIASPIKDASTANRVTVTQKELIVNFMEAHPNLVLSKLNTKTPNPEFTTQWKELTNILNANGGNVTKNAEKWRKTWSDMKRDVKEKAARIREQQKLLIPMNGAEERLTPLQERVLLLLNRLGDGADDESVTEFEFIAPDQVANMEITREEKPIPILKNLVEIRVKPEPQEEKQETDREESINKTSQGINTTQQGTIVTQGVNVTQGTNTLKGPGTLQGTKLSQVNLSQMANIPQGAIILQGINIPQGATISHGANILQGANLIQATTLPQVITTLPQGVNIASKGTPMHLGKTIHRVQEQNGKSGTPPPKRPKKAPPVIPSETSSPTISMSTDLEGDDDWTEKLIQAIRTKPPIYNPRLLEHSDRSLISRLWSAVCEETVPTWQDMSPSEKSAKGKELQGRWRNMKTSFRRELNKQKLETPGQAGKKRRKYVYFDQLLFLLPIMEDRPTVNECSPSVMQGENSEPEDEGSDELQIDLFKDSPQAGTSAKQPVHTATSTRKQPQVKTKDLPSYEESLLTMLKDKKEEIYDEESNSTEKPNPANPYAIIAQHQGAAAAALNRLAEAAERRVAVEQRKAVAMERFVELFFKQQNSN